MPKPKKNLDVAKPTLRIKAPAERNDQVQSLVRALSLLNTLSEADEGIALTELAQQVGLTTSTAHRLLTTLQQER